MRAAACTKLPAARFSNLQHRNMETITMDRELMHLRDTLIPKYAELIYNGFWYAPEREPCKLSSTRARRRSAGSSG